MAAVPTSAEERQEVQCNLLRQAKAAGLAGRQVEVERVLLEHLDFVVRCTLFDAQGDENTPPDEIRSLEEAVRTHAAGLKKLAAAATAAGEH